MKNIALPILAFLVVGFSYGQIADQNPNYQTSLDLYTKKLLDSGNTTMSTTVQHTYKAIDEWQDRKDRKIENRQQRRLARINRPRYYYNPYGYGNRYGYGPNVYGNFPYRYNHSGVGYGNNFGYNGYGYGYGNAYGYGNGFGNGNGYYAPHAYYRPYAYPVNFGVGGSLRIGRNIWIGF